ncbi:hypothetical protein like AT3G59200 [Hibiscus trionum]|uniref:F-box domain-containing protein n=1 Tax=Hibiscus trionum TaxID=183268 RepID=A0A9W7LGY3_HIBTR|nr:hypothetical protein like AT3G59200 [Hibiscus trionum]
MGKKAKHDDDDRISKLPDSVLSGILCRLPIKDAVSTSILSTRWRYLFVSMLNLDVDFRVFRRCPVRTIKSFTNFMDKLMFIHTEGRIEQFRLQYIAISGVDASRVCGWVSAALWRGVKEIDLAFARESENIPVLSTALLFTTKTLVRLKLEIPFAMTVPIHVRLPNLNTLELRRIKFEDDDSVERLISSCPVLEQLSISCCDMRNMKCLKISNPSLKSLTFVVNLLPPERRSLFPALGVVYDFPCLVYFKYMTVMEKNYSTGNMTSLVIADINISVGGFVREIHCRGNGLHEIFQGIDNVNSLQMSIYPEALPSFSHKRYVAFQNLLHLQILDTRKKWKGVGLFEFLEFTPNLQSLVICTASNQVSYPVEKVPSCVVYQLKELKVLDFDDETSLFKMITYIFKNATVLKKLTVCTSQVLKIEEELKITKKILNLPRCSINCQVLAF